MDRHTIRKLLQRVFVPCKCNKLAEMLGTGETSVSGESQDAQTTVSHETGEDSVTACESSTELQHKESADANNIQNVCPGHEVGFPIYDTVMALDLPEENISTLLCYLELHPRKWIKVLSSVYLMCKIQCYGGAKQLKIAAKKVSVCSR